MWKRPNEATFLAQIALNYPKAQLSSLFPLICTNFPHITISLTLVKTD